MEVDYYRQIQQIMKVISIQPSHGCTQVYPEKQHKISLVHQSIADLSKNIFLNFSKHLIKFLINMVAAGVLYFWINEFF